MHAFAKRSSFIGEQTLRRLGFLLIDGFALMSTAAAMEPFRAANHFAAEPLYETMAISPTGDQAHSSLGAAFPAVPMALAGDAFDLVFVVAGGNPLIRPEPGLAAWLRGLDRRGVALGGISGGAAVLALAGLMEGRRFTLHWHHIAQLRELSDRYLVEQRVYVIDRDRYTCAGGTAPLDMMHAIIAADHGAAFAQRISDWFIQTEVRSPDAPQQASLEARYGPLPRAVLAALELMESHIADPLELSQIAALAGLSPRQLQRQFQASTGRTAMATYRSLRLDTARQLLTDTRASVAEIAEMTGFASQAGLAEAYRRAYGEAPTQARRTARV